MVYFFATDKRQYSSCAYYRAYRMEKLIMDREKNNRNALKCN